MARTGRARRKGWAGQWDRHVWDMPAARSHRRGKRRGELRLMLEAGLLGGLLLFNAGQLLQGSAAAWLAPTSTASTSLLDEAATTADPAAVRVIDGDTFDYRGDRIRISDIDTPELRSRCDREARLASAATARLRVLLAAGPFDLVRSGRDQDRYGRKLRVVVRGGRSVGDMLVAEGLARTWTGRREPWC